MVALKSKVKAEKQRHFKLKKKKNLKKIRMKKMGFILFLEESIKYGERDKIIPEEI